MADEDDELEEEAAPEALEDDKPEVPSEDDTDDVPEARPETEEEDTSQSPEETTKEIEEAEALQPMEQAALQESKPSSPADKYRNFLDTYQKLQKQRQTGDLVAGLVGAGDKIGQSMAGRYSGNVKPDLSGVELLQQQAGKPVTDFEQAQVVGGRGLQLQGLMNAADPNSQQSKLTRQYLSQRLGLNLSDDVSAQDAAAMMKMVGRPMQTKYQKVNGTWVDPTTGKAQRMSAIFDPGTGTYKNADTGKALPGFLAEGLNPFQITKDPNTGQNQILNKSRGIVSPLDNGQAPVGEATTPQDVNASLDPVTRKELNDKVTPAFNKETEKIQQRLNHVPVILQRLDEAQTNPAALPQLKAELARFDVGDQRLAQQELEMFAKRQGYKGWEDLLQAKTQGTISSDFADDMRTAISHVSDNLKDQISQAAEKHAKTLANRMPPGQKVDPQVIAPLLYGDYKPKQSADTVHVRNLETGQDLIIPRSNLKKALDSKKYQEM